MARLTIPTALALAALALAALAAAPALAQRAQPSPVVESRGVETTAIIESIDQQSRQVLLRRADGSLSSFRAGPEVRNLAQVKPGDRVSLRYAEAIAVGLAAPGARGPGAALDAAALRAARGERPGLAAAEVIRARVRVTEVDPGSGRVGFVAANGTPHSVVVQNPRMLEFARGLRAGDQVDVSYAEGLLIAVTPAP